MMILHMISFQLKCSCLLGDHHSKILHLSWMIFLSFFSCRLKCNYLVGDRLSKLGCMKIHLSCCSSHLILLNFLSCKLKCSYLVGDLLGKLGCMNLRSSKVIHLGIAVPFKLSLRGSYDQSHHRGSFHVILPGNCSFRMNCSYQVGYFRSKLSCLIGCKGCWILHGMILHHRMLSKRLKCSYQVGGLRNRLLLRSWIHCLSKHSFQMKCSYLVGCFRNICCFPSWRSSYWCHFRKSSSQL